MLLLICIFIALTITNSQDIYPSDILGTQIALGKSGLNKIAETSAPLLIEAIESSSVNPVTIDKHGFEFKLKHLTLKDIDIDTIDVEFVEEEDSGIQFAVRGFTLKCSGDYSYKLSAWPHVPSGSGDFDITIGSESNVMGSIGIEKDNEYTRTNIEMMTCKSKFDITKLHFGGGITSDLLDLFKSTVESSLESTIDVTVCDALNDFITETNSSSFTDLVLCSVKSDRSALACALNLKYGMGTLFTNSSSLFVYHSYRLFFRFPFHLYKLTLSLRTRTIFPGSLFTSCCTQRHRRGKRER